MYLLPFFPKPRGLWSLLLLFPFSFFNTVFAQSDTSSNRLGTVLIQATRTGVNGPVPHTNISAENIARSYHAQDVPYLLTGVPSVVETSDAGAGIGYAGLRIRGSDPTRVNVTINGVPLNDAESQGVFWVDLPDLAASAAEIQVQRGVGTSTNGAGAFGATVNVDLSKVASDPYAVLTASAGSFATNKYAAQFGTGLMRGKYALSGRLSKITSDGYIDRASADLRSLHLSGAYLDERQSLQWHYLDGHEVTYQAWNGVPAQYLDTRRTYNTAGAERPGTPYNNEVDDYTQRHLLAHYRRLFSHGLSLQLNGHYTRGFGFYEQYKAGESFADYALPDVVFADTVLTETDLVRRRRLDNHFYGATFALRWNAPVNVSWMRNAPVFTLGGAWSRYEGRHFGELIWAQWSTVPKDFVYYDNDADKRDANTFLKMEMGLSGRLTAFLDMQLRRVQYEFLGFDNNLNNVGQSAGLTFFNPKIGATYALPEDWMLYGFFGVGHREPNRDDYTQSSPGSRPRPECLHDYELGLKRTQSHNSLSVNFFLMQYRDQLVLDGRLNDVGAYIRTNVPDSYRAGVEIEGNILLGRFFQLNGSAALSRNRIREFTEYRDNWDAGGQERIVHRHTDLAFSPAVVARAEAAYKFIDQVDWMFSTALAGKYVGEQYIDNTSNPNTRLPGFFFTDLRLNCDLKRVAGGSLHLILSVNNLFDARYVSNAWTYRYTSAGYDPVPDDPYSRSEGDGVYNQTGFFPQAGRHWMATLRMAF